MTDKLAKAIETREERIDEYDNESDKFVLEMLEEAKEHHNGEEMMVEEVRAIKQAANGLHQLVTNDALPFIHLEGAIEDMGVVQDEHREMRKMKREDNDTA